MTRFMIDFARRLSVKCVLLAIVIRDVKRRVININQYRHKTSLCSIQKCTNNENLLEFGKAFKEKQEVSGNS